MNYGALTIEELKRYAPIDPEARAYVADHAEELLDPDVESDVIEEAYERGKGEGYDEGHAAASDPLRAFYARLETERDKLPDGTLKTLLGEFMAELG